MVSGVRGFGQTLCRSGYVGSNVLWELPIMLHVDGGTDQTFCLTNLLLEWNSLDKHPLGMNMISQISCRIG